MENKIRVEIKIIIIVSLLISFTIGFYIGNLHYLVWAKSIKDFADLGGFIGGVIGTIVAIGAIWFSIETNRKQNKQFEKQSFENIFFQLLKHFTERRNALETVSSKSKGSAIYIGILTMFKSRTDQYLSEGNETIYKAEIKRLVNTDYPYELSLLLIHFKSILKYIERSNNQLKEKQEFANIYYSQLTLPEIEILKRIAKADKAIDNLI